MIAQRLYNRKQEQESKYMIAHYDRRSFSSATRRLSIIKWCTVDSRYLEVEGTLWNTSRYPYLDISDMQNWGKYQSNNQISQVNMQFDSFT